MKICPDCSFQNPEDIHICLRCAATLHTICLNCSAEVPRGNKFCGQCGTRLDEITAAPTSAKSPDINRPKIQEQLLKNLRDMMPATLVQKMSQFYSQQLHGQRREVTILCVDIANIQEANASVDHEDLYLAIDYIMHMITNVIYRYEGTIDQFSGQGLTAIFGIPINHENDPERAVRAASDMLVEVAKEWEEFDNRFKFQFRLRIGINTGSVIIGDMRSQQHVEYNVIGDTVNFANTLLEAAQPDQILVSFSTYQRCAHIFEFQILPVSSAMDENPMLAYQPTRLRYKPGQVRGIPGLRVPMVGRLDDFKLMQAEKDIAESQSQSHIFLISGEAGLGKSRLVAEFVNTQEDKGTRSYWGTCASYMRITPYRVIADVIRNILGISELDSVDHQKDALLKHLEMLGLERHDLLPNLLHVLGLMHTDPMVEARLRLLEPLMLQRETQLALRTYFSTVAQGYPTIFIFDDLHWVDQASQQFLEYYCQVVEGKPIILILISRDFEISEPARLIAEAAQKHITPPTHIQLAPLSIKDSRLLINQFIPEKTETAIILKNSIIKRASGNPFYTEELVRILMDLGGMVLDEDNNWVVKSKAIEFINEVPGTLQDILLARFDRLPSHLKQTAQRASVLGDSFAFRLLEEVYTRSREELAANLAELEARDFLIPTILGNEEGYLFKHPLLQETIYKTHLRRDLRNLHFDIAQAIESGEHWLPAERSQVLAWHYGESHTPERAIPFLLTSAEKASQHFANDTVIQLYRQALSLMRGNPEKYSDQINQARISLGQALKLTGQFDEAARIFKSFLEDSADGTLKDQVASPTNSPVLIESLRELADLRAREGKLDEAVTLLMRGMQELGDNAKSNFPTAWRRLVDRLAWVYFRQGKLEEAHNWADLALMDVRTWETDDPLTLASLYNTIGGIYWSRSRFREAISSVERSLSIYRDLGYQWGVSVAQTNLGILNYSIGKWKDCVDYLERADQIRSAFGNHPERPNNLINLGEALIALGEYERAREKLNTGLEISKRLGSIIYWAYSELKLAQLAIMEEDSPQAAEHLEKARVLLEPIDEVNERTVQYYLNLAQLKMMDGDLPTALSNADQALEFTNQGGFQDRKVEVLHTLGRIYTQMGNYELAERHLKTALDIKGSQFSDAIGMLELGHLYLLRAQNSPPEEWAWFSQAENNLDRAVAAFTNLGAKRYLLQAQSLQSVLPTRSPERSKVSALSEDDNQALTNIQKRFGIPTGEWYQATILSIMVTPSENVDEEVYFESVGFLMPFLQEIINEFGGHVIRHQNGLTGIFGTLGAHEDDPVRAVETAMQIVNFYSDLYKQTHFSVSIRLGITMGKIVAGWRGLGTDADQPDEFLASGKPLQFARTLLNYVSPTHIWVTQPVYMATSYRFQYEPVAHELVDHLDEKSIYQLEGEREQILPVRGLIGLRSVFVGRQSEIKTLLEACQMLINNNGRMVWIEGDPGIGKSRLTRELENQVYDKGIKVLRGVCTSRRQDIAFSVFSELFSNALDIQPNYTIEQIREKVDHHISEWSLDQELHPFIEMLVGVQPSGQLGEQLMALEPEQLRRQIFVSLNRLISRLAAIQPLIMIFDDIQWIDATSADLLLYLSPLIFSHRVMFICIQRSKEASTFEHTLTKVRGMTEQQLLDLQIKPLTSQECHALLDLFLGDAQLDQTLMSLIVQQSGGNPYYLEEFVRMLVEQDYLRVERGKLEVNQSFEIDSLHIPSSLEMLIRSRVDALPVGTRQLLQVASVIGHQFSEKLLAEVSEQKDIEIQLDFIQNRGMLHYLKELDLWEFGHPLIEIIVYNTVLKVQRRILHNRTAYALENQWLGQESKYAEVLAYHFGKAENNTKNLEYLILAGERAASRYANDAATTYFEQAYDLLSAVIDANEQQCWQIITGLGTVYQFTGKFDASLITLQAGLDLLEKSSIDPDQIAHIYRILADTYMKKGEIDQAIIHQNKGLSFVSNLATPACESEAARIYARMGWSYFRKAMLDEAQSAVLKAEELASQAKNLPALAAAENLLGGINWSRGLTDEAMKHTRQAMLNFQKVGYTWGEAIALNNLAILEVNSGNWNAAANLFQRALKLRIEMGDVEGIALTHNNLAHLAIDQGRLKEAETSLRASLAVSEPLHIVYHQATSYTGLVKINLFQKQWKEATRMLKIANELATEVDAREILTELKRLKTVVTMEAGDLELARRSALEAIEAAIEINNNSHESSARRVLSEILLRKDNAAEAIDILDETWERLSSSVDELETGRVRAQYAKLCKAKGDMDRARQHYDAAHQIFTHLGAEYDLQQLKLILP